MEQISGHGDCCSYLLLCALEKTEMHWAILCAEQNTASLKDGDCTPTLCAIFCIIFFVLSSTSSVFLYSVSQFFANAHYMAASAVAFALR